MCLLRGVLCGGVCHSQESVSPTGMKLKQLGLVSRASKYWPFWSVPYSDFLIKLNSHLL